MPRIPPGPSSRKISAWVRLKIRASVITPKIAPITVSQRPNWNSSDGFGAGGTGGVGGMGGSSATGGGGGGVNKRGMAGRAATG